MKAIIDGYKVEIDQDGQLWIEKEGFYASGAGLENTGTLVTDPEGNRQLKVPEETQDKIFAWEEKHI
tara:strand:+ start:38 stop:238 length:201 start_codon:yes stop_codon:yes gene_type:complete